MVDYEPIALGRLCNVAASFTKPHLADPALGSQTYHGLPFTIGPERPRAGGGRCLIGFDDKSGLADAITIPIRRTGQWLIFAHALLQTDLWRGGPVGEVVAHYVVQYSGGRTLRLPVRERFEIAFLPTSWGGWPFVAQPDHADRMWTRDAGPWGESGNRQTEAIQGHPHSYYLWPWKNPNPRKSITSVTVEPAGKKFILAAITLSRLAEPPFNSQVRREVKITLPKKTDADRPFDMAVSVDRGMATYPYALPRQAAAEFVKDHRKGWGQSQNGKASPAYVEIAASPSATVTVKNAGKPLAKVNWGELQSKRRVTKPRAKLEIVDHGKNWVHTTVLDDETGKPLACRIHFRSPEGVPYQPHGHHNQVCSNQGSWHRDIGGDLRMGQITYAYIDGSCQGWLPRGDVIVDVARGYEYQPLRKRVTLKPGQRELVLRLKRFTNMAERRWFCGDSHVHFLSTQGAFREAQGEGLAVVNLLQSQWGHLFTNTEEFTGRPAVSDDGNTIVYCSQENRQHILGHLTLWGLKEPVMPWCSDGPSEAELAGNMETTLSHWADACHAQGGTVIIPHMPNPNGEPATLIATGRADAVELLVQNEYAQGEYYRYLNCGYRLPLVGGTDKMTSDVPVGLYRTYAYIPPDQPFNYDTWTAAVRAGRTFLSGGPMIEFTADGAMIGETLKLGEHGGTVELEATADSIFPLNKLEIVQEGRVVASTENSRGAKRLNLEAKLKIDHHSWLAARCGATQGMTHHVDGWGRGMFAHTSPIYVAVGGAWSMFDQATADYMLTLIGGCLEHIHTKARHHREGAVTHHHRRKDHMEFLEEPFQQAIAAIHKRMHRLGIPH